MISHIINEKNSIANDKGSSCVPSEEPYRQSSYCYDASKAIEFALIYEGCVIKFMKFNHWGSTSWSADEELLR